MKKCYRIDYVGNHDSDYVWSYTDEDAIELGKELAKIGVDYIDIGHCELELAMVVEVDDTEETFPDKRIIWY